MKKWIYFLTTHCSIPVVLIGYAVYASDDCAAVEDRNSPVKCYKCSTHNNPDCYDPFNESNIEVITCKGACTKWVQKPKNGPTHIVRTCSADLNLKLHYAYVCMKESRPGDGKLCFCHRNFCNSASSLKSNNQRLSHVLMAFILACLAMLIARCHFCSLNMQIYANEQEAPASLKQLKLNGVHFPCISKEHINNIIGKHSMPEISANSNSSILKQTHRTRYKFSNHNIDCNYAQEDNPETTLVKLKENNE